ncbi:endopeptidase La [Mesomycoplasma conjunctivae]|uniref:endopeptidase La n=1 Tax=Mesomycoplasma conjunctivae TaxID=45361 RepID=UPI003DA5819D
MIYRFIPINNNIFFPHLTKSQKVSIEDRSSLETLMAIFHNSPTKPTLKDKELVFAYFQSWADFPLVDVDDLREFATLVKIKSFKIIQNPGDDSWKRVDLTFDAVSKVKIVAVNKDINLTRFIEVEVKKTRETVEEEIISSKVLNQMLDFMSKTTSSHSTIDQIGEIINNFKEIMDLPDWKPTEYVKKMVNTVATNTILDVNEKYEIFALSSYSEKIKNIFKVLRVIGKSQQLEDEINLILKTNLDRQQTEFLLREKIKAIRKKLGEDNKYEDRIDEFVNSDLAKKQLPKEVIEVIKRESAKLKGMMATSPESNISKNYLDLIFQLPWRHVSQDKLDLKQAEQVLEQHHFGLTEIKKRIIEYLAALIHRRNSQEGILKSQIEVIAKKIIDHSLFAENQQTNKIGKTFSMPILTLVGPPGTGKTSIVRSIADAIGKKFVKISLGGVKDESEIRGHRRTYIGAMPGKIIQAIRKSGVSNPLILLDEIDKMGGPDFRGDPSAAMLEVLDPEQNRYFQDHYLELEYDLSKVMFVATANDIGDIPEPLMDRVEIIELSSYTFLEKIEIAKNYLIPEILKENSLDEKYFQIDDETIDFIIKSYTLEAGVRGLKRLFDKLARKIIVMLLDKKIKTNEYLLDKKNVKKLLGVEKIDPDSVDKKPQIGVVNGLGYSPVGGSTLQIEVTTVPGRGELKLTGSLKEVMQESARIALTYVQSRAKDLNIDFDFENNQIHIHVPEGAVPKDGPSAGITFTTAIISALANKAVPQDIAMTGEITLRGKVLAIGGLKEKSLGAYKNGIKRIFIPQSNEKNLVDIPQEVKKAVKFISVKTYQQIYDDLFK